MSDSSTRTIPRLTWPQVDRAVRAAVEDTLGARVLAWQSREEGFSPGLASVCELDDGRSVFIKAASSELNEQSRTKALHEIEINRILPHTGSTPKLLATVEHGPWVAAVFETIEGRIPGSPWTEQDLDIAIRGVESAHQQTELAPAVLAVVPHVRDMSKAQFQGWQELAEKSLDAKTLAAIEPWLDQASVQRLASLEAEWFDVCEPSALIHADLRSDNMLIDGEGSLWLLDWANAALGPAWFDIAAFVPSITMQGGPGAWDMWSQSCYSEGGSAEVDPAIVDVGVVAIAGYFTWQARQPPVPSIPMLRAFQEAQAKPARAWAKQRLGL